MREYYPEFVGVDYDSNERVCSVSFVPLGKVDLRFGSTNLLDDEAGINPIPILLKVDPNPFESSGFIIFDKIGLTVTGYHDGDESQRAIIVFKDSWGLDHVTPISAKDLSQI